MIEDHDDFEFEPIPGLPAELPPGETLLWQGSPSWWPLARSAFHVRKVAVYFALVLVWKLATVSGAAAMTATALWTLAAAASAIGLLLLLAWLYARSTIYTLTTKRLVIRSGLALPVTLNLPLALIDTAQVTKSSDGSGAVALVVAKPHRIALLALWPNARPWRLNNPQPMLRCIENVDAVAALVAKALEADAGRAPAPAPLRAPEKPRTQAPVAAGAGLAAA